MDWVRTRYSKGDFYCAPFGAAKVNTCSKVPEPKCTVSVVCDTGHAWITSFNGTFSDALRYFTGLQTVTENDTTGVETVHTVALVKEA